MIKPTTADLTSRSLQKRTLQAGPSKSGPDKQVPPNMDVTSRSRRAGACSRANPRGRLRSYGQRKSEDVFALQFVDAR